MSETKRLRALSAREKKLEKEKSAVNGRIVNEIVEIMTKHQIDLSIVRNAFRERFIRDRPDSRRYAKRPIRYRDPETGETWAGVGVKPRWLRDRMEEGHKQEDFEVNPPIPVE